MCTRRTETVPPAPAPVASDVASSVKQASSALDELNALYLDTSTGVYVATQSRRCALPARVVVTEPRVVSVRRYSDNASPKAWNATECAQAMPLYYGIAPVPNKTLEVLVRHAQQACGSHLAAGMLGIKWVLMALGQHGHQQLAFDMMAQTTCVCTLGLDARASCDVRAGLCLERVHVCVCNA